MTPKNPSIARPLRTAFHMMRKGHLAMAGRKSQTAQDVNQDEKEGLSATAEPRDLVRLSGVDPFVP